MEKEEMDMLRKSVREPKKWAKEEFGRALLLNHWREMHLDINEIVCIFAGRTW